MIETSFARPRRVGVFVMKRKKLSGRSDNGSCLTDSRRGSLESRNHTIAQFVFTCLERFSRIHIDYEVRILKALGLLATAFLFGSPAPAALAADVTVDISGAIANGPRVFVALCADKLEASSCVLGDSKIPRSDTIRFEFRDVAPSRYAILAFQDIDGTGVLRRSKLGIPLEPFALSNDAGRSGKPSFEAAAVTIGGNGGVFRLALRDITHRSTP